MKREGIHVTEFQDQLSVEHSMNCSKKINRGKHFPLISSITHNDPSSGYETPWVIIKMNYQLK